MADGRWVMTEEELNNTVCGFGSNRQINMRELPNYGRHLAADNRDGKAPQVCAFCSSAELITGLDWDALAATGTVYRQEQGS